MKISEAQWKAENVGRVLKQRDVLISIALPLNHLYYWHHWDAPKSKLLGMSVWEL